MKKKVIAVLLSCALATSLVACGGTDTDETQEAQGSKGETLIVYTNSGSDGRDTWLMERAEEAGFDIQVLHMGASDLTNRIIAEKNNSIADVIFGLNNIEYEKLVAEDVLLEWEPEWVDGVDLTLTGDNGLYYPVSTTPLLLIYNNEMENPPTDWIDLTKPEYKGLYQLHGLDGGTGKTIFASIISRYADPDGELGISDEGWEIAKEYLGNCHLIAEGEDSIGAVIDRSLPMDMHWASGVLTEQETRDYKFGIMTPEIGVPFVVESVSILNTTKKAELAEEFLNWLGSAEIQLEWANTFGTIPAQEEAVENTSDSVKELVEILTPQVLDWEFISQNVDSWVEKAELEFVQ